MSKFDSLPEAPEKWRCKECDQICVTPLSAVNPFDEGDVISGCPNCKDVNTLEQACQFDGCKQNASIGTPGGYAYRYFWSCHRHRPHKEAER